MAGRSSGRSDLKTRGNARVRARCVAGRGGFDEMNVVLSPALASLLASAGDTGLPCLQGPCLFGWAWSILALTFLSAWFARGWQAGDDNRGAFRRFAPATASGPSGIAASPL